MNRSFRLLITTVWVCHLIVRPSVLTSQRQAAQVAPSIQSSAIAGVCLARIPRENPSPEALPFASAIVTSLKTGSPTLPGASAEDGTSRVSAQVAAAVAQDEEQPGVKREPLPEGGLPVEISAEGPITKEGPEFHLRDHVRILFRGYLLTADDIRYNSDTGEAIATGHVRLEGGPRSEIIEAERASYNVKNETGTLENVTATLGMAARGGHVLLSTPNPLAFTGSVVQRTGPDRFVVQHALVTTCDLQSPAWSFQAEHVIIDVGREAQLHNAMFRLHRIPMFYLPFIERPVETLGRQSGFLLPSAGQSSTRGTILGESFYWAINRSTDATLGAEYFSKRGWAQHGEFRMRPARDSSVDMIYSGVLDRGLQIGSQTVKQGGEEVRASGDDADIGGGFRAVADLDYLSSFLYRLAFSENFSQAVNSEVKSVAFASRERGGYGFDVFGSRYQNFESTTRGDLVTILHAPSAEAMATDHQLGGSRVFWSYSAAAEGVSRREPGFLTSALVGRFDVSPAVGLPLILHGWSFRPELALRDTYYTERVEPGAAGSLGVPTNDPLNRRALETGAELRPPALSRIFGREVGGRKLKHTIEPRVVYRYINGIDNFQNVIRFDARDLLSNTNEVEYALVNRLYGKRTRDTGDCGAVTLEAKPPAQERATPALPSPENTFHPEQSAIDKSNDCEPQGSVRELVRWEVAQKAFLDPNFGGAVINGKRNVLTTTAELTGIAFLTEPRNFSPIVSRLRVQTSARTDVQWNLDYDLRKGRISGSTVFATWRLGEWFMGGNQTYFQAPGEIFATSPVPVTPEFNQFRLLLGYGHPDKRGLTAAGSLGYDKVFNALQYGTIQTSYNWNCIGLSFEYRRFSLNSALGAVRVENQFRFALNLANIGTFGNLRRQERLF